MRAGIILLVIFTFWPLYVVAFLVVAAILNFNGITF